MKTRALTTYQHHLRMHQYSRATVNKLVCQDIQGRKQKCAKPLL